jgi:short-subunit dehydrogenase
MNEPLQTFSVAVVTGGSSGLGKSFIRLLQTINPRLLICNLSRRKPCAENLLPGVRDVIHFPCDLARAEDVARAAREVEELLVREAPTGRVLLVNNSGVGGFGRFPAPGAERQLEIVDVNVRAVVDLTSRLLPVLLRRGGAIINVASVVAHTPTPYCATYGASKAFLLHWSLALGEELRGSGVRVLAVSPGTTRTEFFQGSGARAADAIARKGMAPDAVVRAALQALAQGRSSVVPGLGNRIATGAAGLLPKAAAARMAGRVMWRRIPFSP